MMMMMMMAQMMIRELLMLYSAVNRGANFGNCADLQSHVRRSSKLLCTLLHR